MSLTVEEYGCYNLITPPIISGTTTPPSINIQGDNPAIIQVGDTYTDLGVIEDITIYPTFAK